MISEDVKNKFCNEVMKQTKKNGGEYIEAVLSVSETFGFGPEVGAKLLSKPIVEKIKIEGEQINLLPKISQLPF
tara:strand:+ start:466 stop:687 length:222 start_codon:yes stop_codon:yes gene_type:complete